MEKSKFEDAPVNGHAGPPIQPDNFSIRDPATGKMRRVREMNGPELAKFQNLFSLELQQNQHVKAQTENTINMLIAMINVLQYETERRRFSLALPGGLS